MREIKFRVWNSRGKAMLLSEDIMFMISLSGDVHKLDIFASGTNLLAYNSVSESEAYILMQFTGLTDKNGKKIFEGDIIEHYALYGSVIFEDGMFSISSNANTQFCNCRQPMAFHDINEMEIIGNIYENPELIK